MGDKNRGIELAKFIRYHFPYHKNVLIPADGNFVVAGLLNDRIVTVVDPKIRGNRVKNILVVKSLFYSSSDISSDLIIGLHPDGATGEIMDYAVIHKVPAVIVPCCHIGKYSTCNDWVDFMVYFFTKNNFSVEVFDLKISGKNRLVKATPRY